MAVNELDSAIDLIDERKDTQVPTSLDTSEADLSFPPPIDQVKGSIYEESYSENESLAQLEGANGVQSKPAYMDSMEDFDESHDTGIDEEDIEGAGELVAGLVGNGKSIINRYFKKEFKKRISEEFQGDQIKLLNLVMFLEKQDEMNSQNIDKMKEFAEIYKVSLPDMISAYVNYTEIREELQAGAYEDWQKEGIKKYTEKCIRKYFVNQAPDPALMLGLYIATTLGMDIGKIVMQRMNT